MSFRKQEEDSKSAIDVSSGSEKALRSDLLLVSQMVMGGNRDLRICYCCESGDVRGILTFFFIYYRIQFDKIMCYVVFKRKCKNENMLYIIFSNLLYPFYDLLLRMTFLGKEADHFPVHKSLLIRVKGK